MTDQEKIERLQRLVAYIRHLDSCDKVTKDKRSKYTCGLDAALRMKP